MHAAQETPRFPYRKFITIKENGEVVLTYSGEIAAATAWVYRPSTDEIRRMLRELRMGWSWPQGMLAGMLGTSRHTLRRWEDGSRRPSAAAAKLIWLLYFLFVADDEPFDLFDWFSWGNGGMRLRVSKVRTRLVYG